jgi:hypothetical protein
VVVAGRAPEPKAAMEPKAKPITARKAASGRKQEVAWRQVVAKDARRARVFRAMTALAETAETPEAGDKSYWDNRVNCCIVIASKRLHIPQT